MFAKNVLSSAARVALPLTTRQLGVPGTEMRGVDASNTLEEQSEVPPGSAVLQPLGQSRTGFRSADFDQKIRQFSTSAPRTDYAKDIIFGAAGGNTIEKAFELQASTDNYLFFSPVRPEHQAHLEDYREAYRRHTRQPLHAGIEFDRPWVLFNFANRNLLDEEAVNPDKARMGNVDYAQQAVKTALERGGNVYFTLSGWTPEMYMQESLAAEIEHSQSFPDYLDSYTVPAPKITNMELGAFMEKGMLDVPVQFLSQSTGELLDGKEFRRLFNDAVQACRSDEHREAMKQRLEAAAPRDTSMKEFLRSQDARGKALNYSFDGAAGRALQALKDFIA